MWCLHQIYPLREQRTLQKMRQKEWFEYALWLLILRLFGIDECENEFVSVHIPASCAFSSAFPFLFCLSLSGFFGFHFVLLYFILLFLEAFWFYSKVSH